MAGSRGGPVVMAGQPQKLPAHHASWLTAHPERDEAWLRLAIREGFHVHHMDGDKANNDPDNLVLIDGRDHSLIHQGHRNFNPLGFLASDGTRHASAAKMRAYQSQENTRARLKEGCRAMMYWLEPARYKGPYPHAWMREWRRSWGGGHRKWGKIDNFNVNWESRGYGQLPSENHLSGIAFPYFGEAEP